MFQDYVKTNKAKYNLDQEVENQPINMEIFLDMHADFHEMAKEAGPEFAENYENVSVRVNFHEILWLFLVLISESCIPDIATNPSPMQTIRSLNFVNIF